jgi:TRAP-type C4-dicarboxylate transport system permease small subunit
MRPLIHLSDRISKILMVLAAAWAFGLTFVIVADIFSNNVYGRPIYGVREIVMNSIVMIVFMQVGYAIRSHSMLRADTLVMVMPIAVKRVFLAIGYALGAAFFVFIIIGGYKAALYAWTAGSFEGEGALRVPTWPVHFTVLIGSGVAAVNYVVVALIDVFGLEEAEPLSMENEAAQKRGSV